MTTTIVKAKFQDSNMPDIIIECKSDESACVSVAGVLNNYAGIKAVFVTWQSGDKSVYAPDGSHLFTIPKWS